MVQWFSLNPNWCIGIGCQVGLFIFLFFEVFSQIFWIIEVGDLRIGTKLFQWVVFQQTSIGLENTKYEAFG